MKSIRCLLGMHSYSQVSAEVKVVDERCGYLVCRVRNCCIRCGKPYEDIIAIPFPEWLNCGGNKQSNVSTTPAATLPSSIRYSGEDPYRSGITKSG